MISRFIRLMAIALPAIGLISCTVNKQPDSWKREARIEWDENQVHHSESLTALNEPNIPIYAKIVFEGTDIKEGTVKSACISESSLRSGHLTFHSSFSEDKSITIGNLIHQDLWQSLSSNPDSVLECSFAFSITNNIGSTWEFKSASVILRRLDMFQNLDFRMDKGAPVTAQTLAAYVEPNLIPINESTKVFARCDHFSNSVDSKSGQPINEQIKSVLFGKLNIAYGTQDEREEYLSQNCRIAIETRSGQIIRSRQLTSTFPVEFTRPKLTFQVQPFSLPHGTNVAEDTQSEVIVVQFKNSLSVPLRFRLTGALGANVNIRLVSIETDKLVYNERPNAANLEYHSTGATIVNSDPMNPIYEVLPGGNWRLWATLHKTWSCLMEDHSAAIWSPDFERSMQNVYEFSAHEFLAQGVRNQAGELVFEPLSLLDGEKSALPDGLYAGWAPTESWKSVDGKRPSKSIYREGDSMIKGMSLCGPKGQRFN